MFNEILGKEGREEGKKRDRRKERDRWKEREKEKSRKNRKEGKEESKVLHVFISLGSQRLYIKKLNHFCIFLHSAKTEKTSTNPAHYYIHLFHILF